MELVKVEKGCKYPLVRPSEEIQQELNALYTNYDFSEYDKKNIEYHFNLNDWKVNLADTKQSMINYDIMDTINSIELEILKEDGETQKEYIQRRKAIIKDFQFKMVRLYKQFKQEVFDELVSITDNMDYYDLLELFCETWKGNPFDDHMKSILENMVLLMGDKAMMENVVAPSGMFKSTNTMMEINSLPNVLLADDVTIAGISRDTLTKGIDYLDNTIIYYNDIGDSTQMRRNFEDVLETVFKKLYSEGIVTRTLAGKNTDRTIELKLVTPHGFKAKFNSVKPIFINDKGQSSSRVVTINLPVYNYDEALKLIRTGKFGSDIITKYDPRIFKNIFEVYIKSQPLPELTDPHKERIFNLSFQNMNGTVNFHNVGIEVYKNQMMLKLYKYKDIYKKEYWTRIVKEGSLKRDSMKLLAEIKKMVEIDYDYGNLSLAGYDVDHFIIAKAKSSYSNAGRYDFDAFTIEAVRGIPSKWISNNQSKIEKLLRILEENMFIAVVGKVNNYNVYVVLQQTTSED